MQETVSETNEVQSEVNDAVAQAQAQAAEVVTRYRELVASAPDLVPGLVRGDTLEEIDASAVEARRAYAELSRRVAEQYWVGASVPIGNPARSDINAYADTLKPEAKIAFALRRAG